jgi:hypothetical protein
VTDLNLTPGGTATVHVLHDGYAGRDGDDERVAGTVTLIMDGDAIIVVAPGMPSARPRTPSAPTPPGCTPAAPRCSASPPSSFPATAPRSARTRTPPDKKKGPRE